MKLKNLALILGVVAWIVAMIWGFLSSDFVDRAKAYPGELSHITKIR